MENSHCNHSYQGPWLGHLCVIIGQLVSVASYFKAVEHIISDLINLDVENLLTMDPHQYGFVIEMSCIFNLINVFEKVTRAVDSGYAVHTAYMHLAKTFDTIPHTGIIDQPVNRNINLYVLWWIDN